MTIQSVIEPEVSILKSSTNLYSFENLTEVFTNLDKVKVWLMYELYGLLYESVVNYYEASVVVVVIDDVLLKLL